MQIAGFEKNTLLDYPGKVASTIFTYGCNMRCGYCHNPELVIEPLNKDSLIPEEYIIEYFKKRKGLIDALVITGGEPTLQIDLIPFIKKIKNMGMFVKLDTNGSYPKKIEKILNENIVDYWAMDIKYPIRGYHGNNTDLKKIKEGIKLIKEKSRDYEFRATFVKGLHNMEDVENIGKLIKGGKNFYIQNFRAGKTVDPELSNKNSFTEDELVKIKQIISKYVKNISVR